MSPSEVRFVRTYIFALRRDYRLVRSVLDLMRPENLGQQNFVSAVKIACGLDALQNEFDAKISKLRVKNKMRVAYVAPSPSLDDLAELFSLSFFKLVTTIEDKPSGKNKEYDGWYSGKPNEWKKTLANYKGVSKPEKDNPLPDILTKFFNAALKLFPFDNKIWSLPPAGDAKKIWPPSAKAGYDDDLLDDDEADETGENPFDWLFDDDDE